MKKLLLIALIAISFSACGGSDDDNGGGSSKSTSPFVDGQGVTTQWQGNWNDQSNSNYATYQGKYNPIGGTYWEIVSKNGSAYNDMVVYMITGSGFRYATTFNSDKTDLTWSSSVTTEINDKQIKVNGKVFEYKLITFTTTDEKLQIYDGKDTYVFKVYDRTWYWKGDWNDPFDRHYQLYQGKYNPLKGTWKKTHQQGQPTDDGIHIRYGDDLIYYYSTDGIDFWSRGRFEINDTAVDDSNIYTYKITGNTVELYGTSSKITTKFIKVQ